MSTFKFEVQQTLTTIVEVEAPSYAEALEAIQRADYPLPERHEWDNIGWLFKAPMDEDYEYDPTDSVFEWTEVG